MPASMPASSPLSPAAETPRQRPSLGLLLAGALWTLPLWLVRFLPMVDYPQQLAAASILRHYGDPARALSGTFEIVLWRPQGLFETLVAGLAFLLPVEAAGKVLLSLALLAVPLAAAALCRRTGRPAGYALLALAFTYNEAFFWGFADNLLAYPLVLFGAALADRRLDRPPSARSWAEVAAVGLLFYAVHLEFLLVYAGVVGWLALVRRPGILRFARDVSAVLPGLALGLGSLGWAHFHTAEAMTGYQQRLAAGPTAFAPLAVRLANMPSNLFSGAADGAAYALAAMLLGIVLVLALPRATAEPATDGGGDALYRTRFLSLAGWIALLYFVLPNYTRGYLVADRLLPLAAMFLIPALPRPPSGSPRLRLAALLIAGLLAGQLLRTATGFLRFAAETDGLAELLDSTEPGQSLAGLIYESGGEKATYGWTVPPYLVHTPAYYQVVRGGRVHFSFAQFFNSPIAYRPGKNQDDPLLAEWDEWNPQSFDDRRHGPHYRYYLVRGGADRLAAAFGPHLAGMRVKQAGRWFLVERPSR